MTNKKIKEEWMEKSIRELMIIREERKVIKELMNEVYLLRIQLGVVVRRVDEIESELQDQVVIL